MPATDYLRYDKLDLDQIAVLSIIISFPKHKTFNVGKIETIVSRSRESKNFGKSRQIYYQTIPCDLTKKMNTNTLCFAH